MRTSTKLAAAYILFNLAAALYATKTRRPRGRFIGVPYDFTIPTPARVRRRLWSERNELITRPVFGSGWALNLRELGRRLGLVGDEASLGDGERDA